MTDQYMKEVLRVAVAQICQTIGYNATQTAPLELLQDVLDKFMREFTRDLRRQVEHYNRTEANLDDMTLTLNSINVNVSELLDYVNNVEPVPFAAEIPKFPARKNSYLNFLKPGSKEVLTRPVHVHDHLPPMLPPEITQAPDPVLPSTSNGLSDIKPLTDNLNGPGGSNFSMGDQMSGNDGPAGTAASTVLDKTTLQSLFKPSSNLEDGDRPTREVSSVVMTTGGYISPAVEGKMPEAIVPDIIDKLLGLDAPPPPPPPPPPPVPTPAPVSRPASRSANTTPAPMGDSIKIDETDKDKNSTSKESKKSSTNKSLEFNTAGRKSDSHTDLPSKKDKLINSLPTTSHQSAKSAKFNKKKQSALMQHNPSGMHHSNQTNYANMLLKKAKKQKPPIMPGQPLLDKHIPEKPGKLDPAEKTQRKYVKMLQKMAKQGKIPPELLNTIMGSEKKSKILNPAILGSLPPGPEKIQLEKLLKKHVKQRQKQIKQQMMQESQKHKKNQVQPPPLVPLFTPVPLKDSISKPLTVDLEEQKAKTEPKDSSALSPMKPGFMPNLALSPGQPPVGDAMKNLKTPVLTDTLVGEALTPVTPATTADGKELKLSAELKDRSKLNIFKKITKQKTPKSSSPTPLRIPGMTDAPLINLPSGTTITPAPGPGPSTSVGRTLFPPLPESAPTNIINLDDIKDSPTSMNISNPPTDPAMLNRVFGEKPPGGEVELVNKPKKRGRKPGSKNSPKIPGVLPANSNLLKKNKKMKMDPKLFTPHIPIPSEFAPAAATGNSNFDNVAHLFGNPINPMEWAQNKQLHQQMLIMAAAKERKEQKKKNRLIKHDLLNNEKSMMMPTNLSMGVPTNEEVQSINKKLMRMDTILKPAPSAAGNDLSVDTSLITGKKLPSPALFPPSSTSPLKSPVAAASKRLMQGMEAMAVAAAAGLGQPFMLPNRPAFPNLPSNMLSMLPFPFTARPGLIPTPGLFPTPGLGAFQNNPKNPLLPGLFPFPNLRQPLGDIGIQETEDLSMSKKKGEERSYCNVAPLVPEFLKLNTPETIKITDHHSENDLPKTPKPRNSHSSTPQENLLKKMVDAHTPESATSGGSKSIPSTPGGMSLNTFEQLMKKNDSPIELVPLNKSTKGLGPTQDTGLDFSMNKKHTPPGLGIKPPITLNNEPIEVSDDSDEMSQPPLPSKNQLSVPAPAPLPPQSVKQPTFNMDEMFIANTNTGCSKPPSSIESDLSSKELKKLKKQVKKTSASITSTLINPEKSDGVSKLAGGADLIPLTSTGLAYSSKNIPFNSLTANANPTFNPHKSDFNPTSSSTVFDNVTITAAIPSTTSSSTNVFDMQKKRKEHKKIKKELKEGKIKKKKDKKDKSKSKEKAEKYLLSQQISPPKEKVETPETPAPVAVSSSTGTNSVGVEKAKEKELIKKLRKEKKKEKQRSVVDESTIIATPNTPSQISAVKDLTSVPDVERKQKSSPSSINSSSSNEQESAATTAIPNASIVPKLTLKLGSTQSPTPMDDLHKNNSSSVAAPPHPIATATAAPSPLRDTQREPSPELARISPLVTRPPKHKVNPGELASGCSSVTNSISTGSTGALDSFGEVCKTSSTSNANMIVPPPSPWLSGGTISASSVLLPHQLLQTTKHDMTAVSTGSSQSTDNTKTPHTSADRQSPLTLITETSRPSSYIDAEGNRIWICPACGKVDDGSPMIGCDGCDAWYHWVCVGIFVAPKDNEDWFCRVCITRKKGLHGSDKKRKRNKKK